MIRTGRVRWFNKHLGYGFIAGLEDGQDIFIHNSVIPADENGWRGLKRGQLLRYKRKQTNDGLAVYKVEQLL